MCKKEHVIFVGLLILSAVSFGLFLSSAPRSELSQKSEQKVLSAQITATPTPQPTTVVPTKTRFVVPSATAIPTSAPLPKSDQSVATPTTIPPTAVPTVETMQVRVSINAASEFSLSIEKGKNQCDVLVKALQEGKISQLLMRYNDSLQSYGVYQINGIGKENQVWWTYKVNDQSPPVGCSHVEAKNNDAVSWTYIGPS